jgi:predicted ATPase
MNIKSIRLQNFRGFKDAPIVLKPLTVLLGPNSAGKSSFGQALAAMSHVHKYYAGTPQASLTPPAHDVDNWPVDLGTTKDLRTEGQTGHVKIVLETSGGNVELGFGDVSETRDALLLSYISHPSGDKVFAENPTQEVLKSNSPGTTSDVVIVEGATYSMGSEADWIVKLNKVNNRQWQENSKAVEVILDGLIVLAASHQKTGTSRKLSTKAQTDLRTFLEKLTYLRANRKRPSRGYKDDEHTFQPIGYSGEWTPSILFKRGLEQVSYVEPPDIPNSVDEAQKCDSKWKVKQEPLREALNAWLVHLGIASRTEIVQSSGASKDLEMRVALKDQSPRDITEIGFGVSQVIPVLVAGLLQPEDSLFIVDLPEAHLHPRPQGAIADFFCSLALTGRSCLVETHSEMFFHQLRLRAAQDPSLMDKIAVYFIDAPKNGVCSQPRQVGLGYEEELRWPEGFLLEAWKTQTRINAIRQARAGKK